MDNSAAKYLSLQRLLTVGVVHEFELTGI